MGVIVICVTASHCDVLHKINAKVLDSWKVCRHLHDSDFISVKVKFYQVMVHFIKN